MKNSRYNGLLRVLFPAATLLLSAALATGCYQAQEANPGTVSLNAVSGARSLLLGTDTDNVWVVGLVIDGSFEPKLKELLAQEDLRKATDGSLDASKDLWLDLAMKSTVKFDGGRPFFQYSMSRINPAEMPATGSFTIAGIPANKDYFLYLMVLPNPLSSIEDFTDDPLALSPVHYFDPDTAPDDITIRTSSSPGSLINLTAGWYSFTEWEPGFAADDTWTSLTATVWTDESGTPVSSQPFTVSPGESVPVSVLLTDFQP